MTRLRLRIISDHRRLLGERSTVTFGVNGGTIGRSADNDWILPDPQRYVSAHHARIHFIQGRYVLEDTSTNGIFVNDGEQPVREHGPYPLQSGDVLRLGEYQVVVALEPAAAQPAGDAHAAHGPAMIHSGAGSGAPASMAGQEAPDAVPTRIDVLESLGRASQTDIGASLNLDDLLVIDTPTDNRVRPVNAYGQAVVPHPVSPGALANEPGNASEPDDEAIARRIERLARAAARSRDSRGPAAPVPPEVQNGLQAFCRGAGIEAGRLPADAQAQLLHLVGQLLREALVGLKDLERAREEARSRFRIDLHPDPDDPRPSLVRSTVDELIVEILSQHESRRLDAVQWLREAVEIAKSHERATSEALRAAFIEFIGRFDPAELEARFQRALRRSARADKAASEKTASDKGADGGDSRYWQLFVEFYRNLAEMPADRLPHTFVEAFATAYRRAFQSTHEPQ